MDNRPSFRETMMTVAKIWARRSTCLRAQAGAVIATSDGQLLSTGYNGAPRGLAHCSDLGCVMDGDHCIRSVHAEMNAIIQCAAHGVSTDKAVIYCTHEPCPRCMVAIIQAGIKTVYYHKAYGDSQLQLFARNQADLAGVSVTKFYFKGEYDG